MSSKSMSVYLTIYFHSSLFSPRMADRYLLMLYSMMRVTVTTPKRGHIQNVKLYSKCQILKHNRFAAMLFVKRRLSWTKQATYETELRHMRKGAKSMKQRIVKTTQHGD